MTTFAILASGPSMNAGLAERLYGLRRIVVNDAYLLAPDAEALVGNDAAWWRVHPEALTFPGERYCSADVKGTTKPKQHTCITTASNSSLAAVHVAICKGATRVYLFGCDMHDKNGMHFFGLHTKTPNPTPARFLIFMKQFLEYSKRMQKGVEVFNATPGSALKVFPMIDPEEILAEVVQC